MLFNDDPEGYETSRLVHDNDTNSYRVSTADGGRSVGTEGTMREVA
jgi:hypothetical protein